MSGDVDEDDETKEDGNEVEDVDACNEEVGEEG